MQPLMSEQTFIIISCTLTYGVLLCVKFNKKKIAVEKNMDELAYKSSNKKSKPVKLENYT
jgi:hypothetical protein